MGFADGRPRPDAALTRLAIRLENRGGPAPTGGAFEWGTAADHCRWAWLRGAFLARGSLSLASGRTHLEFVLEPAEAMELARRLEDVDLPASVRIRRGRGVVTWKSGDLVGTFLRGIGGGSALLELEVRQVTRSMRGDLNRVINAESANLQRAVTAAGRQLETIDQVEAAGQLEEQPPLVRMIAAARRETPEATLAELAQRLELTRSAVQRAFERLERIALHPTSRRDDSGMMSRRCARSSSLRTGRCTRRRATRETSQP